MWELEVFEPLLCVQAMLGRQLCWWYSRLDRGKSVQPSQLGEESGSWVAYSHEE